MAETNGAIYGIVSEEGAIKVGNPVVLMDHATLQIIAKTVTDQYGGYMFNNLDPDKTDYMVFTVDNDGVEPKNALIKDYVTPITTNNGTVAGSFLGVLDALGPVASGVPTYRGGGGGAEKVFVSRMHGNNTQVGYNSDWGGIQSWSDDTASPASPQVACPIPGNTIIRAMKHTAGRSGWRNRITRWAASPPDRPKAEIQPAINTAGGQGNLTVMCTHYTDPAGPMTYSVCYDLRPTFNEESETRSRYVTDLFYPDSGNYYPPDCFFNVCVEANHELRIKWLVDNNGAPVAGSKRNILVATLSANKWYTIIVRVGLVSDPIVIDVVDNYAGTRTTYTPGATLESLNKQQNYGSGWVYGTPVRNGFLISGPHNQAVNSTFNTWNGATCWTWLAFATGNGYSGPWAWWNKKLSNNDVDALCESITNLSVAKVPRGLAEIYKFAPQMYVPCDEPPGVIPWQTRKGQAVHSLFTNAGKVDYLPPFSLRRRNYVQYGQAKTLRLTHVPHPNAFTVIGFINQPSLDGVGAVYNVVFSENSVHEDATGGNYIHTLYLSIEAGGRPRAYWRNTSNGYNDNTIGATDTPLKQVGQHMVAWVFDVYSGLNIKAYIDGVLWGTTSVTQQQLDNYSNGIDSKYSIHAHALVGSSIPNTASAAAGAFCVSGIATLRPTIQTTDLAVYSGCLSAADIAEIYAAWQIVIGTDSHA